MESATGPFSIRAVKAPTVFCSGSPTDSVRNVFLKDNFVYLIKSAVVEFVLGTSFVDRGSIKMISQLSFAPSFILIPHSWVSYMYKNSLKSLL